MSSKSDPRITGSANLLWSQRHNPVWLPASTFLGRFHRSEANPSVWESTDGHWTAELRRAPRGSHLYLAMRRDGVLLGTYDGRRGWHAISPSTRQRLRRSTARQLAFAS